MEESMKFTEQEKIIEKKAIWTQEKKLLQQTHIETVCAIKAKSNSKTI